MDPKQLYVQKCFKSQVILGQKKFSGWKKYLWKKSFVTEKRILVQKEKILDLKNFCVLKYFKLKVFKVQNFIEAEGGGVIINGD